MKKCTECGYKHSVEDPKRCVRCGSVKFIPIDEEQFNRRPQKSVLTSIVQGLLRLRSLNIKNTILVLLLVLILGYSGIIVFLASLTG